MTVRDPEHAPDSTLSLPPRHPVIIQGGMGVGVSNWRLARAVSMSGQLGVVTGTAAAVLMARRLQLGDAGGHLRRALERFPVPGVARRILDAYLIPGGKAADAPFKPVPMPSIEMNPALVELTVAANFAEVFLAKEGHGGVVGVNYLEKLQLDALPSLFGAMLAGVDYVLIGAGVPKSIPGCIDRLVRGEAARLRVDTVGLAPGEEVTASFDPAAFCGGPAPALKRPYFLAIVSSSTLATALARKSNGRVDGFVIEGSRAGGHNAPPRGPMRLSESGEPIYAEADLPDLGKIRALGLPFWLAGACASPERLAEARAAGAAGIQVGTAFAFCEESAITAELKLHVIAAARACAATVRTDPAASPTGFPFKVLDLPGTLSDAAVYGARPRVCDLGYLRSAYRRPDGSVGHRCPAEPVEVYVAKGGEPAETVNRKCLCNGLFATVGLGQVQSAGAREPVIVTAGDDLSPVAHLAAPDCLSYHASDVVAFLLGESPAAIR